MFAQIHVDIKISLTFTFLWADRRAQKWQCSEREKRKWISSAHIFPKTLGVKSHGGKDEDPLKPGQHGGRAFFGFRFKRGGGRGLPPWRYTRRFKGSF